PSPGPARVNGVTPVLEKHVYGPGGPVGGDQGVGFLDVGSGVFESWTVGPTQPTAPTVHPAPGNPNSAIQPSADGRLLFLRRSSADDVTVVDRQTALTYR